MLRISEGLSDDCVSVGSADSVGEFVGAMDGLMLGTSECSPTGVYVGSPLGFVDRALLRVTVGIFDRAELSWLLGALLGSSEALADKASLGTADEIILCVIVGLSDGMLLG